MHRHIELLVFVEDGNVYGVLANQIDELLSERAPLSAQAADAPLAIPYKGRQLRLLRLAQYMRQQPAWRVETAMPSSVVAPPDRILVTTCRRESEYVGVLIQEVLQLVSLPIAQISPLPKIMAANQRTRLIWGIALLHDAPVILLDLEQL